MNSKIPTSEKYFFKNIYFFEFFVYFFVGFFLIPFLFGIWKCTQIDTEYCVLKMFATALLLSSPLLALFLWLPYEEELFIYEDFFMVSSRSLLSFKREKIYFRKIRIISVEKLAFFFRRENPFYLVVVQREHGELRSIRLHSTHNKEGFQRLCELINEKIMAEKTISLIELKRIALRLFGKDPKKHCAWFERNFGQIPTEQFNGSVEESFTHFMEEIETEGRGLFSSPKETSTGVTEKDSEETPANQSTPFSDEPKPEGHGPLPSETGRFRNDIEYQKKHLKTHALSFTISVVMFAFFLATENQLFMFAVWICVAFQVGLRLKKRNKYPDR